MAAAARRVVGTGPHRRLDRPGPARAGLARHRQRPRRRPRPRARSSSARSTPSASTPTPRSPSSPPRCGPWPTRPARRWRRHAGVVTDVGSVKALDRRRRRRPPVRRRPPDGRLRAGGRRRRRRRPVRGRGVGAHARPRPPTTRRYAARPRAWSPTLGADVVALAARAPRRAGGGGVPRAAPHRRHAHAPGRRRAPRSTGAAAPGRRRLPRHDPHRRRATRASGPTSARENRDAIVDVLDGLLAALHGGARRRRPTATATALLARARAGPRGPRQPARRGSAGPATCARCASRCPTAPGVLAEVTTLAGELDVNIADLEIAHSSEGDQGVLILLVEAGRGRAPPRRPGRARATARRSLPLE